MPNRLLALIRPRRALALFASVAALAALPACIIVTDGDDDDDRACSLVGCANGANIEFVSRSGEWAPGDYTFIIFGATKVYRCEVTLPLPPCEQVVTPCDSPDVMLQVSGCALAPAAQGFGGVYVTPESGSIDVSIRRDGNEIAHSEISPHYVTTQPNGEGCEPICSNASAKMDVP